MGAPSACSASAEVCELAEQALGVPIRRLFYTPSLDGLSTFRKYGKTYGNVLCGCGSAVVSCDEFFSQKVGKMGVVSGGVKMERSKC